MSQISGTFLYIDHLTRIYLFLPGTPNCSTTDDTSLSSRHKFQTFYDFSPLSTFITNTDTFIISGQGFPGMTNVFMSDVRFWISAADPTPILLHGSVLTLSSLVHTSKSSNFSKLGYYNISFVLSKTNKEDALKSLYNALTILQEFGRENGYRHPLMEDVINRISDLKG